VIICHIRYKPQPEDQLLKAFQVLDQDSKGYITQEDLAKYMTIDGKFYIVIYIVMYTQCIQYI